MIKVYGAFFGQRTIFIYKYQFNHAPENHYLQKQFKPVGFNTYIVHFCCLIWHKPIEYQYSNSIQMLSLLSHYKLFFSYNSGTTTPW